MNYVIATKLRNSPNSNLGYIQPYIIEEGGKTRIVKDDDFPNRNTIFVKGGYEEFIESKFQGEDLFRIPFNDSDNYKEEENNSCAYMALATEVSDLRKVEYFHLIDSDFDIKNRFIYFPYKPRRYIFIRSLAKLLYGPFDYDEPEYNPSDNMYYVELKALQRLPKNGSVKDWSVYKLSEGDLEIKSILNQKILLANLDKVESLDPAVVDYISDEQLIKWGNDLLQILDRLPKKDLRNYQELIQVLPASDSDFISLRRERFLLLIDRTIFWSSQQSSLLSDYLQSDSGIEKINNYLETNYEIIQNAAKERFEKKYNEMEKPLKDEIEVLLQQKNSLEKEIDKTKENVSKKQQEDLTQEVLNIQDKLAISKRELEEVCDRLQIAKTAEKLRSERDYLERRKEELKEDLSSLQETKKLIVDDINTSQEALKKELRKLKPYVDLLNGIIPDEKIPENEGFSTIKIRENKPKDANELILEVTENLKQYGRDYQFEDVANFVLCTQQNFLTVFAGLPGVGKTSLVSSLAKSLNLESEQRFITIPTARGWTSQRDILGFYNSLTHKYQPSPTGLYRILKSCHFEYQKIAISQQSPCWILLDEANLSPIEHYWSSFLGMCDDHFTREIYTGDPETTGKLSIPPFIRFIATVNYDNTTEPLSPRVIDRVPIVLLKTPDKQNFFDDGKPSFDLDGVLSNNFMEMILCQKQVEDNLTNDESRLLTEIVAVLQSVDPGKYGIPIIVSPRKQKAIGKYCKAARDLMKRKYELRAFDYSVAQHILPLINGNGERFYNRLSQLSKIIRQLDYSQEILNHIIDVGQNEHHYYRFFC